MDMLNAIEVRVLGSLMEKELATPEYYPLSLNGLVNACNQKTNRDPVMTLDEKEVQAALLSLKARHVVFQSDVGRVPKYWHNYGKQNNLIRCEEALLCILLLRGPQTAGELRGRSERLCSFENLEEVNQYLDNLSAVGLVAKLPLQPGRKEQRFTHLLSGEPEGADQAAALHEFAAGCPTPNEDRLGELEKTVARLQEEIELLKNEFLLFRKEFE